MKSNLYLLILFVFTGFSAFSQTFTSYTAARKGALQGVELFNSKLGYVCGDSGELFRINADRSMTSVNPGTNEDLWRLSIIPGTNGQELVVVGDDNTVVKVTAGSSQTATPKPVSQAPGSFVFGVHCLDASNWYVSGGDFGTFTGTIHRTTDGGNNWVKTSLPGTLFIDNIRFATPGTGYAAGGGTSNGAVFKTNDSGKTWNSVKSSGQLIVNVFCFDENNVVAVGLGGQIYKTTDGGQNWTDHSTGTDDLYGIQFLTPSIGFAAGGNTSPVLLKTTNGGATWSPVTLPAGGTIFWNLAVNPYTMVLPSGNGEWFIADIAGLGVNEPVSPGITVYPNPASDWLQVELAQSKANRMEITEVSGKTVLKTELILLNNKVNIGGLIPGTYFITLYDESNTIAHRQTLLKL